jgi:hypothetical protein
LWSLVELWSGGNELLGMIYGNDEITCGNVYSTIWDETLEHKVDRNNAE